MLPSQYGRAMENLAENAWTQGSDGRLVTYLPVVDSRGVDRVVTAPGSPALFIQVKAHQRTRPGDRLAFAIPEAEIGDHEGWYALLLHGDPSAIESCWLIDSATLRRHGEHGTTAGGLPALKLTLSPTSPTWSPYHLPPDALGQHLEQALMCSPRRDAPDGPPHAVAPPQSLATWQSEWLNEPLVAIESLSPRTQEEGAFFETWLTGELLRSAPQTAPYRPAVDVGRDLLVQRAGTASHVTLQIKGTTHVDGPGLARFQVRRRTFDGSDERLLYAFIHAPDQHPDAAWLVPAPELSARAHGGDDKHISFEAHVTGPDPRWAEFRVRAEVLAATLDARIGVG